MTMSRDRQDAKSHVIRISTFFAILDKLLTINLFLEEI